MTAATNVATIVVYLFIGAVLVTALVLLGVMVGRGDANVNRAVRHVFYNIRDPEHVPLVPASYDARYRPDVVYACGDAWALANWSAVVRDRFAARNARLVVLGTPDTTAAQVASLRNVSNGPLSGNRVAVFVQAGWRDLLESPESAVSAARAVVRGAEAIARTFASAQVYVFDYPDVTAGSGYTAVACAPPLDAVLNNPARAVEWLSAGNIFSAALQSECAAAGVAFVPLRQVLARVGSSNRRGLDVSGAQLDPDGATAAFDTRCDALSAAGLAYQAELAGAFIRGSVFYAVG